MPHLVILYTPNLESEADFGALCRALADVMVEQRDEAGQQVFPTGGVRVLAYPAAHAAVADGSDTGATGHGFVYLNLRMGAGRSGAVHGAVGGALRDAARQFMEPVLQRRHLGITLQIDEGRETFDAKFGNLHALFRKD